MSLLGVSSDTAVNIYPHRDFRNRGIPLVKQDSRASDGTPYRANEPKYEEWRFTIGWVPASDAAIIQSLWTTGAELLFWEDPVTWPNSAWPVYLSNKTRPLDKWQFPYYKTYKTGRIELEARSAF